jgi:VCBS repeat-containing protein
VTAATAIVGQYGTLTINPNGGYSYAVNNRVVVKQ